MIKVLLAKSKLDRIEVLIYKILIDSNISHNELVLIRLNWSRKSPPLDLATRQFIANINIIIKQCYYPV